MLNLARNIELLILLSDGLLDLLCGKIYSCIFCLYCMLYVLLNCLLNDFVICPDAVAVVNTFFSTRFPEVVQEVCTNS